MFGLLWVLKEVEGLPLSGSKVAPAIGGVRLAPCTPQTKWYSPWLSQIFIFAAVEALTSPIQSILSCRGYERMIMTSSALFYVVGWAPIVVPTSLTFLGSSISWMAVAIIAAALHSVVHFCAFLRLSHAPYEAQPEVKWQEVRTGKV